MLRHPLHDFIGYRLIQASRAHRSRAEAALNQLGLHTGQEMLLFYLWDAEGPTQSQLVEALCVEPPTISKSLQRLEQAKVVERRPDPDDARVTRVFLTPMGRALRQEVREVWNRLEKETLQGFSDVEIALLRRMLDQLTANLGS